MASPDLFGEELCDSRVGEEKRETKEREEEEDMLPPPIKRFCSSLVRKIAVEGNIATGKSTFLRILRESSPSYHVISEPLNKWLQVSSEEEPTASQQYGGNLLDMFYKEPIRWAYTFQAYACLSRLKAQLEPVPKHLLDLPNPTIFFERSVHSDKFIFAQNCHDSGLMSELEWQVYSDWHSFLLKALPLKFDGFIYLRTNPQVDVSLERLHKRNRPEESTVSLEYLHSLHTRHEEWLVEKTVEAPPEVKQVPILILDCNNEFESDQEMADSHLKKVSEFINSLPKPTRS